MMNASRVQLMLRRKSHSKAVSLIYGLDADTGANLINDLTRDIQELTG